MLLKALLCALACLCFIGCSAKPEAAKESAAAIPVVAVAKVTREDLSTNFVLSAEFRPNQEIDLHAKVAGYLKAIHVDVGDRVRAGQPIAELEVPEMTQELAYAAAQQTRSELDVTGARTEVSRAESNVKIRQLSYDRIAAVAKQRPALVAQQEIDNSNALLQDALAQVATAKARLSSVEGQVNVLSSSKDRAGTMLAYTRIAAPFSGVITKRYADPGALIQAGTSSASQAKPVVRISQIDRLRLVLAVPESMVPRIRVGTPVSIRVDSEPQPQLGHVSRFSNQLNSATRTMETEVDVANPRGTLMPGMYAYATLSIDRHQAALSIPVQAVNGPEREQTLYVVTPQRIVQARRVRLGLETPERNEVLDGLTEGDMVMIGARGQIKSGDTVQPRILWPAGGKR